MKVELTTSRVCQSFNEDKPSEGVFFDQSKGDVIDVSNEEGKRLIGRGQAKAVASAPSRN